MYIHVMWRTVCSKASRQRSHTPGKLIIGPWLLGTNNPRGREVLRRYHQGDGHDRLNLWMQHRDLRPSLSLLEERGLDAALNRLKADRAP